MALSRRELLAGAGAAGAAALLPRLAQADPAVVKPFRFVHLTDFHVQPELNAPDGMERALRHAMAKKPQIALLGGDLVMDSFSATEVRTRIQWRIFKDLLRQHCTVPAQWCVGNHDVWGWNKAKSQTSGNEPLWGKAWFLQEAGLDKSHHSFEAGGWKWIVLDTVQPAEDRYEGRVDAPQFEWMKREIESTKKPVVIVSHIPLFSPSPLVYGYNAQSGMWQTSKSEIVANFNEVKKVFDANPQVKLCLSGHIHLVDRYDYNGVSYLCNGAVCGAWWLGKNKDFDPGYVVIDLYPDGTFKHEFVTWGWKPA